MCSNTLYFIIHKAISAIENCEDLGLSPSLSSCNNLMHAIGAGKNNDSNALALKYRLLDAMCRAGIRPTSKTAYLFLSSLTDDNEEVVSEIVKEFEENGVLIKGHGKGESLSLP